MREDLEAILKDGYGTINEEVVAKIIALTTDNTRDQESFMPLVRENNKSIVFDLMLAEKDVIDSLKVSPTLYFKNKHGLFEQIADIYTPEINYIRDIMLRKKKMKFGAVFYERMMEVAHMKHSEIKILLFLMTQIRRNNWVYGVTNTKIKNFTRINKDSVKPAIDSLIEHDFLRRVKQGVSYSYMLNPSFCSRSSITSIPRLCYFYNKLPRTAEEEESEVFRNFGHEIGFD